MSQLIRDRFGQVGLRIFNLLQEGDPPQKLEENHIFNICMIPLQEGREILQSMVKHSVLNLQQVQAEESVETAIRSCFQELKAKVRQQPSSLKLFTLQLLAQCKSHERDVDHANEASKKALREVLEVCKKHVAAYVAWVRSDSTFWLSFLRAPEGVIFARPGDRGGGLLDAVAKVACLTVRVWGEGARGVAPRLVLLHTAPFGGREVDLWYKDLSHFDRLVPIDGPN
eukprot:g17101.t1